MIYKRKDIINYMISYFGITKQEANLRYNTCRQIIQETVSEHGLNLYDINSILTQYIGTDNVDLTRFI